MATRQTQKLVEKVKIHKINCAGVTYMMSGRYITVFIDFSYILGMGKLLYTLEIPINMETEYYSVPSEYLLLLFLL